MVEQSWCVDLEHSGQRIGSHLLLVDYEKHHDFQREHLVGSETWVLADFELLVLVDSERCRLH